MLPSAWWQRQVTAHVFVSAFVSHHFGLWCVRFPARCESGGHGKSDKRKKSLDFHGFTPEKQKAPEL
jgi:hypothetical protein